MKRIRRGSEQSQFGVFCAIPVLFTLMVAAGAFYATNLLAVVSETNEVRTNMEEKERLERESRKLRERSKEIEEKISSGNHKIKDLRRRLGKAKIAHRDLKRLDSMEKELRRIETSRKETQARVDTIDRRKDEIETRLKDFQASEEAFDTLQEKLKALVAKAEALSAGNLRLEEEIRTVQRIVDEKEHVQARDLVPAGSLQAAVFVECDEKGVWMMPEKRLLEQDAMQASRDSFLRHVKTTGYVVFMVRPDGFKSFEKYREILETYNKSTASPLEFGYEPVDAGWELAYPNI